MRGNRVTAISGCGCGDLPPLAPNASATTAAPPSTGMTADEYAGLFVGGLAGAGLVALARKKSLFSPDLVIGLGAVGGALLGKYIGGRI